MKTILLLIASLLVVTNWVFADEAPNLDDPKVREKILKEAVESKSLEQRGSDEVKLYYQKGEQNPYTGWQKMIYDNGQVKSLLFFKNGKRGGLFTGWHENGKKSAEGTYQNWRPEGLTTNWHENGEKAGVVTFKNGKPEGLTTNWHENGQKSEEATYKEGKGEWTTWDKDGVKVGEGSNEVEGMVRRVPTTRRPASRGR
jgi:antitoxin component YwqK of YwqJK toxin-antitoxin module